MTPWQIWLLIAIFAGTIEVALPHFTFAFVSAAAFVAMLASFGAGFPIQAVSFVLTLLITLIFVRPRLINRLHLSHKMPSRSQELVGARGEVTETIDSITGTGRVLVNGQDWAARSLDIVAFGKTVEVKSHDGIVLIVKEI